MDGRRRARFDRGRLVTGATSRWRLTTDGAPGGQSALVDARSAVVDVLVPTPRLRLYTQFQRRRNGVSQQGVCSFVRLLVRPCVRASFTKCTIMYGEQTAGPRSAKFCTHMYVDKVPLPANFHPNPQRS